MLITFVVKEKRRENRERKREAQGRQ